MEWFNDLWYALDPFGRLIWGTVGVCVVALLLPAVLWLADKIYQFVNTEEAGPHPAIRSTPTNKDKQ